MIISHKAGEVRDVTYQDQRQNRRLDNEKNSHRKHLVSRRLQGLRCEKQFWTTRAESAGRIDRVRKQEIAQEYGFAVRKIRINGVTCELFRVAVTQDLDPP